MKTSAIKIVQSLFNKKNVNKLKNNLNRLNYKNTIIIKDALKIPNLKK